MYKAARGGKTKGCEGHDPPHERRYYDDRPYRKPFQQPHQQLQNQSKNQSQNRTDNRTDNRTENRATNEHKHPNQYTKGADDEDK